MIRISQIDNELSIYQNKKVVLWDCEDYINVSINLLQYFNINIIALCDENESKWGEKIQDLTIISPNDLQKLIQTDSDILVQTTNRFGDVYLMKEKFLKLGINSYLLANEAVMMLKFKAVVDLSHKNNMYLKDYNISVNNRSIVSHREFRMKQFLFDNLGKETLFICLPTKTGDHTLNNTFKDNNINYFNTYHCVNYFKTSFLKSLPQKIKIITAVRDPIAQNISLLFELINSLPYHYIRIFNRLKENTSKILDKGGDVQFFFDSWLDSSEYMLNKYDENERPYLIQNFIPLFQKHIFNILNTPFSKENGYQILKFDNIEVFVYQLEKMNDILPVISDFVGSPIDSFVIGNEASNKWIADSYKQAQKDLKFSKEYFEKCYNEPYVKHFYSDEDIQKFKNRWSGNMI